MKRSADTADIGTAASDGKSDAESDGETKKRKPSPEPVVTSVVVPSESSRRRPTLISKLISGGQTGADRAALEAGESLGIETGGWAPRGFMTTRGAAPELATRFGLQEMTEYRGLALKGSDTQALILRSQRNVDDADGTLVFRLKSSPGSDKTIGYCHSQRWCYVSQQKQQDCKQHHYRPYLVVTSMTDCKTVGAIRDFIQRHNIRTLNVAGHRDEAVPGYSTSIIAILTEALTARV